jgi:flagellar protein FliJ
MKPFTLQSVLDYRRRLEELAQYRLADAKKVQEAVEQKLSVERHSLERSIDELDSLQKEGIGINELIRHEQRITAQQHNVQLIEKNLTEKTHLVQQEQHNLLICSRERQIMEQLKETQNTAWQAYVNKKEAAMLDEIATTRHEADSF